MSEQLTSAKEVRDVNMAFDADARAAQNDWDSYLDSRSYEDKNGSLHDAESGKFIANPNSESDDDYYNRMVDESEGEGPFANATLKDMAEMIRDARARGDKTGELDAEEAFLDKFNAAAEKYGWEGVVENADGTVTDRGEIATRRLEYYEKIMYGDSAKAPEAVPVTDEIAQAPTTIAKLHEALNDPEVSDEDRAKLQAMLDKLTATVNGKIEVAADVATDEAEGVETEEEAKRRADIRVIRGMSGGKLSDEEIENILGHFSGRSSKLEVKEPVANSNQEAAQDTLPSLEATDAGAEGLEMLDESGTGAGDLETLDEAETPTQPRSRLRRIRDAFTPTGLKAAVDTSLYMRRRERNGRLLTRREKIAAGIGAAALMIGGGLLLMKGHDIFGGGTGSGTGVTGSGGGSPLDVLAQNSPHDVDARRSASTAAKVIEQLNQPFDVEYGSGYIREIQQQAAELGAKISPQRAEQIHHALVEKVGPDYINIQGTNGNDIYTQAGDIRLAAPGKANWDPAAVKTIADQLGLSK